MSGISSKLLGLKFMQRAKEKETMEKASEETTRRTDEAKKSEEWHAPGFAPGALLANGARGIQYMPAVRRHAGPARMSFGGFNKETERMNEENAEKRRRAKAMAEAERAKDEDVTDAEMASSLGKEAAAGKGGTEPKPAAQGKDDAKGAGFKRPPALEASKTRSGDGDEHPRKKKKSKAARS